MMISPGTYYEMYLKDKSLDEIMTAIRSLKREISRLKNIAEHPQYQCMIHPSEDVRISCNKDYLKVAKETLIKKGGIYIPTKAEIKIEEFDSNIPYINKIEFKMGGFFSGYETRTITFDGDIVRQEIEPSFKLKPAYSYEPDPDDEEYKEDFLSCLADLDIGDWRKHYDTRRFGYDVMDGTQWHLYIYFSNGHKPLKIEGNNAYPYNFNKLTVLINIDPNSLQSDDEEN